jgi:hypothetical protein
MARSAWLEIVHKALRRKQFTRYVEVVPVYGGFTAESGAGSGKLRMFG